MGDHAPGSEAQMSETVRAKLFAGAFPVYSYMYLRSFMRLNGVQREQISVRARRRGKGLSVREIEQLAHGFFRGPPAFREETSRQPGPAAGTDAPRCPQSPDGCTEFERVLLSDLETDRNTCSG